jgi:transcriptional regulator with XRE-family HTH domain
MDDLGINSNDLAKITNLDRSTMRYMLTGRAWPDMVTLAKIEQGLEVTLWPNWGDGELRDAQTRIIELEDQIRRLRSNARKKAAAGRVAPVRAGAAATKKRAAARTPRKR